MPFLAILRHDLRALYTSWLVRLWLGGTVLLTLDISTDTAECENEADRRPIGNPPSLRRSVASSLFLRGTELLGLTNT